MLGDEVGAGAEGVRDPESCIPRLLLLLRGLNDDTGPKWVVLELRCPLLFFNLLSSSVFRVPEVLLSWWFC